MTKIILTSNLVVPVPAPGRVGLGGGGVALLTACISVDLAI